MYLVAFIIVNYDRMKQNIIWKCLNGKNSVSKPIKLKRKETEKKIIETGKLWLSTHAGKVTLRQGIKDVMTQSFHSEENRKKISWSFYHKGKLSFGTSRENTPGPVGKL